MFSISLFLFGSPGPLLLCGLSPRAASSAYSLAAVPRFLLAVASLIVDYGLQYLWIGAQYSQCPGFRPQDQQLWSKSVWINCPKSRGIGPDQGSNLSPLHWQVDSSPLDHQGRPQQLFKQHEHIIESQFKRSLYFFFPAMKLISLDQNEFTIQILVLLHGYVQPGNLLMTLY